jgi:hypothetical protein
MVESLVISKERDDLIQDGEIGYGVDEEGMNIRCVLPS